MSVLFLIQKTILQPSPGKWNLNSKSNIAKNVKRCRDGCRHDMLYTSNPIPTSFLTPDIILWAMLWDYWEEHFETKNMYFTYLACILLSIHQVAVVFGTAIPTSVYFWRMIFMLRMERKRNPWKIPRTQLEIKPKTSWSPVRRSHHWATGTGSRAEDV